MQPAIQLNQILERLSPPLIISRSNSLCSLCQSPLEGRDRWNIHETLWKLVVDVNEMEDGSAPQSSMIEDSVTVGEQGLVMGTNHASLAEKRESSYDHGMTLSEVALVEEAQHANRASQRRRSKIKIQKGFSISQSNLVQEPSLHFIKSPELARRCQQDGTIRVFHVAPNMGLELIDQRRDGVEMLQSQHGPDFGTYLANNLLDAWLYGQPTIDQ